MTRQAIALLTSATTFVGMWLAGNRSWKGWAVGLGNQTLWLVFIVTFEAWGLLPLSAALCVVYTRNLVKWRRPVEAQVVEWPNDLPERSPFDVHELRWWLEIFACRFPPRSAAGGHLPRVSQAIYGRRFFLYESDPRTGEHRRFEELR